MKPAMRCIVCAVGSVACLEWGRWIEDQISYVSANTMKLLLLETVSAKEAKSRLLLLRKTPRPVKA